MEKQRMSKPIKMRSSSKSSNKQTPPQFVCIIGIDEKGVQQATYELLNGFPKNRVLPGLLAAAQHFKLNILDNLMPDEHDDTLLEILDEIATKSEENSPEMAKVLRLDILPIEEDE